MTDRRPPTPDEALDAYRDRTLEAERQAARERRQASLIADGWSPEMVRADDPQSDSPYYGAVNAYADSQHPWGVKPEDLTDRKTKSKRRAPRKPAPRYYPVDRGAGPAPAVDGGDSPDPGE